MIIKVCAYCNEEFTTDKNRQKYCCRECQYKSMTKPKATAVCSYCGKTFVLKRADAPGRVCSHKCLVEHMHQDRLKRLEQKAIEKEQKAKEVEMERLRIKTEKELNKYLRPYYKVTCKCCGKVFTSSLKSAAYCSNECRKIVNNRTHDRRLNRCEVRDYSINIHQLYNKYNGICQMCGKKLTFDCDGNDDLHPSVDHIIPIAKGGNHTWDNVQLLCRKCNNFKHDKVI